MLMGVDAYAFTVPLDGATLSHAPPESVAAVIVNRSDPPPKLETDTGRERAAAFTTNGNVIEEGFTPSVGWPGAVTVRETVVVRFDGFAFGAVMVTVP